MKVNPDAAGFDGRRLERIAEHLERSYIGPQKIAGCQVGVARGGHLAYFRSFGSADLERGRAVDDGTIWRIYSMTKPITGVALLSLYERGHFQLSDPVHRFIPSFRNLRVRERDADGTERLVEPHRPVTVRDCLMHTTGFGYETMGMRFGATSAEETAGASMLDRDWTLEDLTDRLSELPLHFHPGTRWLYSVSTDVCARLVEVISGQRFDDYLQREVFDPLGMADTGFFVPPDKADRLSASYRRRRDKSLALVEDPETSAYLRPRSFLSGGGGLVSTTGDYLRFAQMLCNGGELDGVRVLSRKTVELMRLNHLPGGAELSQFAVPGTFGEVGFAGVGFGLTVAVGLGPVATQTVSSAGDFTWGGYASTIFWVDPAEDLVVVFMTQLIPSGTFNFRDQLKTLVYGALSD